MTKEFSKLSDAELQKNIDDLQEEMNKRREEFRKKRAIEHGDRCRAIMKNIDGLLEIVKHRHINHSVCSDANPSYVGSCLRCALLNAKRTSYFDSNYDIELNLVTFYP